DDRTAARRRNGGGAGPGGRDNPRTAYKRDPAGTRREDGEAGVPNSSAHGKRARSWVSAVGCAPTQRDLRSIADERSRIRCERSQGVRWRARVLGQVYLNVVILHECEIGVEAKDSPQVALRCESCLRNPGHQLAVFGITHDDLVDLSGGVRLQQRLEQGPLCARGEMAFVRGKAGALRQFALGPFIVDLSLALLSRLLPSVIPDTEPRESDCCAEKRARCYHQTVREDQPFSPRQRKQVPPWPEEHERAKPDEWTQEQ